MAKSVFEILVDTNYSSVVSGEYPFSDFINQSLTTSEFASTTTYQYIPLGWIPQGFSAIPQAPTGTVTAIFNNLFDEVFSNETLPEYPTAHSSFYEPLGWSVRTHSIANNGLASDGNSLSEDDATNGYSYYNGNVGKIIPELNFRSRTSGGSSAGAAVRIGSEDNMQNLPAAFNDPTSIDANVDINDQAYTMFPNRMYEFGSYRSLNVYNTNNTMTSAALLANGFSIKESLAGNRLLELMWGYETNESSFFDTALGLDSLYEGKYSQNTSPISSNTGKSILSVPQPVCLRLENIFNDNQIGSYVSLELGLSPELAENVHPQELVGAYDDGSVGDFTSSALDFDVDTSDGTFTNTSFDIGKFRPYAILDIGGSFSDMTEELSISNGKLRLKETTNTQLGIIADVDLLPATSYIVSCYVATTQHDLSFSIVGRNNSNNIEFAEGDNIPSMNFNSNAGDGERYYFSFDTSSAFIGGVKQEYSIIVIPQNGGIGAVTEINYIRFERQFLPFCQEWQPLTHHDSVNTNEYNLNYFPTATTLACHSDLVVTSSDVVNEHLKGQEYTSGGTISGLDYNAVNFGDLTNTAASKQTLTTFFNPQTGEPLFLEEETDRFNPFNSNSIDVDGQFTNLSTDVTTARFNLKIGSRSLNLFFDTMSSDRLSNSSFRVTNIKFLTSENSYISRDTSGGDKIQLVYKPSLTDLPSPYIVSNTDIDELNSTTEKTLSWDVSSLSGDSLMIDFGDGSTATEISSAGTGSASVIPNGQNLRIRVESAIEKGSALVDTEAVINSVLLSDLPPATVIKGEPYGSVSSINSSLPHIGAYQQAFRVYSYNHATGALANSVGGQSISQSFTAEFIHSLAFVAAQQYDDFSTSLALKINVLYIGSNNSIELTEHLGASVQTTTITSSGTTTITRTGRNFSLTNGGLTSISIKFLSNSSSPLDIIIGSISLVNSAITAIAGSQISLDLGNEIDIPLNFSIKDFSEIDKTSGGFSKTIKIPATSKNKKALNFKNELNSLNQDIDNQGTECIIKADGLEVVKGNMFLNESLLDENGFQELLLNVKSGNSNWADSLSSINLRDISLGSDYQPITTTSINTSGLTGYSGDIVFPLIDNGKWEVPSSQLEDLDITFVGWSNLKAAFSISKVLDRILESQDITIQSNFLNSNSEWDADFGSEFNGLTSQIYGVSPTMKRHEDDIKESIFAATRSQQESTEYSNWHYASSTNDKRPLFSSKILGAANWAWTADWCFTKLSEVLEVGTTSHSHTTLSGNVANSYVPAGAGGNSNTSQGFPTTSKFQYDNSSNTHSSIVVAKDGFYEINFQAAVDFEIWNPYGFNDTFASGSKYAPDPSNHYFTSILIAEDEGVEAITNPESGSFGANLFDLEDGASQEIPTSLFEYGTGNQTVSLGNGVSATKKFLNQTRITLNRVQYLKAGINYNIASFFACEVDADKASNRKVLTNSKFAIKEFDIELKLSESLHPMNGKENIVYNTSARPKVSYREILPDVSCLEFISEITKLFNLIWDYNPYTSVLSVEPYGDFYDFNASDNNYIDWSNKALITKIKEGAVAGSDFKFKMNKDSSDASLNQEAGSLPLGDRVIRSGTNSEKKAKEMELKIFSSCRMDYDSHIKRTSTSDGAVSFEALRLPRIHSKGESTLEANINEEKPEANNSHEYKLLYRASQSLSEVVLNPDDSPYKVHYGIEKEWVVGSSGDKYDGEFRPITQPVGLFSEFFSYALTEGSPNLTFSDQVAGESLFTSYHKKLFDMVKFRDKMITAEVYLTTYDMLNLDFSKLVRINDEVYLVNKIKDFNFSGETTEVELLLVTIIE